MYRNFRMVSYVVFGRGCYNQTKDILGQQRDKEKSDMVYLVDDVFKGTEFGDSIPLQGDDMLIWVNVDDEPKTKLVDALVEQIKDGMDKNPAGIVGVGGGSAMDLSKAVSVMMTNEGSSAEYQGYDLPKNPSLYHAAIPTLSGTGAEVSRTCVLTGPEKKLGINSDYSVFDQIILDPELIRGAPDEQRFYTGMDCYIHCIESLEGTFLNEFSKSYGQKSLELCREVFLNKRTEESEDKLMMASYCGGMSIAYSQVGVCHALSYGLAYVLGTHHGIGNAIVFDYLEEFYPEGVKEFRIMLDKAGVELPRGLCANLTEEQFEKMINVSLAMELLWENALGKDWKKIMTREKAREMFERM
ncbi:Alcohol dehydrogenase, class IV [Desulfatibacillum alkenivorans DSM 16219]|jgi:3-deoxy-alpha-D-manno-octulosonate 8-oxidase|uniref:Alcohol dehydrogenase, class IV n=1 Tax=Desulfatibacillum alkenivorans DSM 16219 TaxID=1121393 RepID=A0A1M6XBC6_9BACT|nr:iron-containing alcohol dehydrogenase family protein [Desulfatibacillum alkenivorans]SHL03262.1 Alcohol dehydrogenase, class IV [Desulfatibacillum alkenivorans DSM 16219]